MNTKITDVYFTLDNDDNHKYYLYHYDHTVIGSYLFKGNYPGDGNKDEAATIMYTIDDALGLLNNKGSIRAVGKDNLPTLIGHQKNKGYHLHVHPRFQHLVSDLLDVGIVTNNKFDPEFTKQGPDMTNISDDTVVSINHLSRYGQTPFRQAVLAAYQHRCAISGCSIIDILDAAHIKGHGIEVNYHITNGILLTKNIHALFDAHLLGIDGDGYVYIDHSIEHEYGHYSGKQIFNEIDHKMKANLQYHFDQFMSRSASLSA